MWFFSLNTSLLVVAKVITDAGAGLKQIVYIFDHKQGEEIYIRIVGKISF